MNIHGYFPDFTQVVYDGDQIYRFRENEGSSSHQLVDSSLLMSAIMGDIISAASRDASIYLVPELTSHFGPFGCWFTGDIVEPPASKIINLYPRVSTNNGSRWRARKRTKDIIVSPFITGQVQISYNVGKEFTPEQPPINRIKNIAQCGLFKLYSQNSQWIVVDGWVYETGNLRYPATYGTTVETVFPPFPESKFLSALRGIVGSSKDGAMVMACLAGANRGTVDALTAMAEFPETIRSLLDLVKSSLHIYKDARVKSFRLYNKGKANSGIPQSQATLAKNSKELADAIADVWLNYRYNIMPNVLLIEDIVKTLNLNLKEFIRFRETQNKSVDDYPTTVVDGWTPNPSLNVTERVMIKRLLDLTSEFPKLKHLVLTNVAVTGYELIPFSFVFDWFVNLGDAIAAFAVYPHFRAEGSTYSWKYRGSIDFSHKPSNANVNFDVRIYKCDVINPKSVSCLAFNPDLSGDRTKDAVALTWSVFKKDITSTLSKIMRESR